MRITSISPESCTETLHYAIKEEGLCIIGKASTLAYDLIRRLIKNSPCIFKTSGRGETYRHQNALFLKGDKPLQIAYEKTIPNPEGGEEIVNIIPDWNPETDFLWNRTEDKYLDAKIRVAHQKRTGQKTIHVFDPCPTTNGVIDLAPSTIAFFHEDEENFPERLHSGRYNLIFRRSGEPQIIQLLADRLPLPFFVPDKFRYRIAQRLILNLWDKLLWIHGEQLFYITFTNADEIRNEFNKYAIEAYEAETAAAESEEPDKPIETDVFKMDPKNLSQEQLKWIREERIQLMAQQEASSDEANRMNIERRIAALGHILALHQLHNLIAQGNSAPAEQEQIRTDAETVVGQVIRPGWETEDAPSELPDLPEEGEAPSSKN